VCVMNLVVNFRPTGPPYQSQGLTRSTGTRNDVTEQIDTQLRSTTPASCTS